MTEIDPPDHGKDSKKDVKGPPPPSFSPFGESSSSFPLQQTVPIEPYQDLPDDHDDHALLAGDDLPPQYSALPSTRWGPDPLGPPEPFPDTLPAKSFLNMSGETQYFMDPRLDNDAAYLQKWLEYQAAYPPRPFVRIQGSHTETRHHNGKNETKKVTDFDVRIEVTPFLYGDIESRKGWKRVRTADSFEKVRRGTVFRTRAPGFGGQADGGEAGLLGGGGGTPNLKEWCYRYCAASGLKTFQLQRRVLGFDEEWLKSKLESLVRETGYRGRLNISFPVEGATVDVYNSGWVNEWRLTRWVRWLFFLTLMFLFVWPYLFFTTRRWEVMFVEWDFSRLELDGRRSFVSISEEGWLRLWEKGIQRAVLGKRQGILDQRDLCANEQPASFNSLPGSSPAGIVGVVANAVGVVQRQFGWGGDC